MATEILPTSDGQINRSTSRSFLPKLAAIASLAVASIAFMLNEDRMNTETGQKQKVGAESTETEKDAEEAVNALQKFLSALEANIDAKYDSLTAERKDFDEEWLEYGKELRPAVSLFNSFGTVPSKDPFGDQINEKKLLKRGLPANCLDKMNDGFSSSERQLSEALRLEEIQDDNEEKEEKQAYTKRVKNLALLRIKVEHLNGKYAERTRVMHNIHIGKTEDGLPIDPQLATQDDQVANRGN